MIFVMLSWDDMYVCMYVSAWLPDCFASLTQQAEQEEWKKREKGIQH